MRDGWEYRKLGDVCEYAKTRVNSREISIENYIGVDNLLQNCQGRTLATKVPEGLGLTEYREGDVLIGNIRPYLRKLWLADKRGGCNGDVLAIRRKDDYALKLDTSFLYKCLSTNFFFDFAMQYAKGEKMPRGDKKEILKYPIPVPPLSEQERIVSELDLLQSIIEKKKAQLKEYDLLAQSIFYEMFGDPVTNEKGWEVKKLGEVYKLKSGEGLSAKQFIDGPYPVYGGNGISGMHNSYNMDGNYIIIGRVGVYCGNARNVLGKFWLTDNAFQLYYDESKQIPLFVTYLLTTLNLHQYANQAAQPVISNITLKDVNIIFPPLSLQQQFAAKIESIKRQKELIQQSIAEVQTLFDSRMDYYFN